jgi:hypothetical protein
MKNRFVWLIIICLSFSATTVLAQAVAPDPIRLAVGSRVLGMGKAFVGLADDVNAMYLNPAGLANLEKWQFSSMSGSFMEDYNYINLCGAYPLSWGVFGVGFTTASITGGYATRVKAGSNPPVYEIDPTQPTISYYNNVGLLSFATKMDRLKLPFKLPWESMVGLNLKIFASGLAGDGITQGDAKGSELDAGLIIKPQQWLSFGSSVQNLLPATMGGKITYNSGHYESFPALWKNGIAVKILGPQNSLRTQQDQELSFLLDFDYYPTRSNFPIIYHTGLEWQLIKTIKLRTGINQDAAGDGRGGKVSPLSNITYGVGVNYGGWRFDYAYNQFSEGGGMTDSFFSLSYQPETVVVKPQPAPAVQQITTITTTPEAKVITPIIITKPVSKPPVIIKSKQLPVVKKTGTIKGGTKNVKKKPIH